MRDRPTKQHLAPLGIDPHLRSSQAVLCLLLFYSAFAPPLRPSLSPYCSLSLTCLSKKNPSMISPYPHSPLPHSPRHQPPSPAPWSSLRRSHLFHRAGRLGWCALRASAASPAAPRPRRAPPNICSLYTLVALPKARIGSLWPRSKGGSPGFATAGSLRARRGSCGGCTHCSRSKSRPSIPAPASPPKSSSRSHAMPFPPLVVASRSYSRSSPCSAGTMPPSPHGNRRTSSLVQ